MMIHPDSHSKATPAQTEGRLIRWASLYDLATEVLVFGQGKRLRNLTVDLALLKSGDSLLDVGCGTGGVTIPARQRVGPGGSASGIDPAPEMIAVARRKASRKGLEIDFRVAVIEALPFPDASFDVVFASLMVHHLPEHLQVKGFGEIYRVLKPGGRLLIADFFRPYKGVGSESTSFLQGYNPQGSSSPGVIPALLMHHGRQFDARVWLDMLAGAGFQETIHLDQRFLAVGFVRATK